MGFLECAAVSLTRRVCHAFPSGGPHMNSTLLRRLILLTAILLLPEVARAQEAVLTGTVTDATGGVLPGVTVRAVHEASGNSFEAVTDGGGVYRIPARA